MFQIKIDRPVVQLGCYLDLVFSSLFIFSSCVTQPSRQTDHLPTFTATVGSLVASSPGNTPSPSTPHAQEIGAPTTPHLSPTSQESSKLPKTEQRIKADITSVEARGETGNYQFLVGVRSPDTGCEQYADWWEVLNEDGELLYRRILLHSHVDEQPFIRSGGPLTISADEIVWVRAHMHPSGYGGLVFKGTIETGFMPAELPATYQADLENVPPLPDGCAF